MILRLDHCGAARPCKSESAMWRDVAQFRGSVVKATHAPVPEAAPIRDQARPPQTARIEPSKCGEWILAVQICRLGTFSGNISRAAPVLIGRCTAHASRLRPINKVNGITVEVRG
jgi:hypothetical protein